jgi:membrane protein implicated in regulation of membrane protease activity
VVDLDVEREPVDALHAHALPGGESWMLVRGERWRVRCDTALPAGARVRVVQRHGLLLRVEPASADTAI